MLTHLGQALVQAASLSFAWELGDTFRTKVFNDPNTTSWYPGCGHEATQGVVSCGWCGELYRMILDSPTQGDTCATRIYPALVESSEWYMASSYGSRFDMRLFKFHAYPKWCRALDPVCDRCVQKFIDDNWVDEILDSTPE